MAIEINFFSVNPVRIFLGRKTVVIVKYRLGAIPMMDVEVSFSSEGGFTITGKSSFSHSVSSAENFTQNLTLTGIFPSDTAILKLTAKGTGVTDEDTENISIDSGNTLALIANLSIKISAFSELEDRGVKRKFVYKLLKENGFQYNRSTRQWEKQ